MLLRLFVSLLLLTVLSSEGVVLPPDIYTYIGQAYGTGFTSTQPANLINPGSQSKASGFFSAHFSRVTCSVKIKRLPEFEHGAAQVPSPIDLNNSGNGVFNTVASVIFHKSDIFFFGTDNSPPFSL